MPTLHARRHNRGECDCCCLHTAHIKGQTLFFLPSPSPILPTPQDNNHVAPHSGPPRRCPRQRPPRLALLLPPCPPGPQGCRRCRLPHGREYLVCPQHARTCSHMCLGAAPHFLSDSAADSPRPPAVSRPLTSPAPRRTSTSAPTGPSSVSRTTSRTTPSR